MAAEKGVMEKMKASMLSIISKADKLSESQAALIALESILVKKIVPEHPNLPNQSFDNSRFIKSCRSDPMAAEDLLAGIEAVGGISEKTEADLLSMSTKLDKGIESQAALTALVKFFIQQIVCPYCLRKATDEAEKSLSAPLPPTGGSMAAEGDLAGKEAVGGVMEKMNACMLSINSKADKLSESQAALIALASVLVKKIVPDHPNLPNQSFHNSRSDPKAAEDLLADLLAGIEAAGGISEKTEAYLLSMNSKLDKGIESQAALTALVKFFIQQIACPNCLKKATDEAEKSLSAPLPPTGGSMTAEGDVSVGEAVGGISEKTQAYLLLMNSKLDKVVESQEAITDLVMVLIEQSVCPDCLKLLPTAMYDPKAEPKAVGELTERLLTTKL